MNGREVVIVEAVRTPIGRGHPEKGYFKDTHPNELLGKTYTELIERAGIEPSAVEDVICGCVQQYGEQMFNIGRNAWLQAGLPVETPATTVDRQCGSAQQAVNFGAALVASGVHDDEIGLRSHQLAHQATEEGRFEREIVPFSVNGDTYVTDQGIRPDTSVEKLAELQPAFKEDGKVTAGNSSQISDGAAAVLLMSREKADALGVEPRARIYDQTSVGVDPVIMLTGEIPATQRLL